MSKLFASSPYEEFERTLRDLLIIEGTSERVAINLVARMKKESPGKRERVAFIHFLVNAGFYKEAVGLYVDWFKEKKRIPLMAFCHLLQRSGFRPKGEFFAQFFQGLDIVEEPLFHFSAWDEIDPRFAALREKAFQEVMRKSEEHKQSLLTKLEYFQINRMIDEEQRLLDELIEMHPHDSKLREQKDGFKMRWAEALIARRALESFDENFDITKIKMRPDEQDFARILTTSFTEAAARRPKLAYDLALGLYFLDLYEGARAILESAPPALNVDWLYIECLLRSRRHLECLGAISKVEVKYASDPETTFGATYFRAQALNGLGQIGVATQLLKSIVSIRPGYRAATSLLLKWAGRGLN